jgi:hypothetical protein
MTSVERVCGEIVDESGDGAVAAAAMTWAASGVVTARVAVTAGRSTTNPPIL